jgi:hypothetical protein
MPKTSILFILLFYGAISGVLLQSCEDVITLNLKDTAPKLVVEGNINNLSDSVKILLHKSTDYFRPTGVGAVSNATVTVSDSRGNSYLLTNNSDGSYSAGNLNSMPDDSYTLHVNDGGAEYTASSTMPYLVKIDSMVIQKRPDRADESQIVLFIKDPPDIPNYYMVKVYKNDTLLNNDNHFILYSDKYFDGKSTPITINARRIGERSFVANDTVRVQLINLDKMMYDYYQVLRDITEGEADLSASTPSNPPNNISNGALGYFSARSINEKTEILK